MRASGWLLLLGLAVAGGLGANAWSLERERRAVATDCAAIRPDAQDGPELQARHDELQQRLEALSGENLVEKAAGVEALKRQLHETRLRYQRAMMQDFPTDGGAAAEKPANQTLPWKPVVRWSRQALMNRGRGSALDAMETLAASLLNGDADGVQSVIVLDPGGSATAQGVLETLTAQTRAAWPTPQSYVAMLLTTVASQDCASVTVLYSDHRDPEMMFLRWENADGGTRDLLLQVKPGPDGYRIAVPLAVVQRALAVASGHF